MYLIASQDVSKQKIPADTISEKLVLLAITSKIPFSLCLN